MHREINPPEIAGTTAVMKTIAKLISIVTRLSADRECGKSQPGK